MGGSEQAGHCVYHYDIGHSDKLSALPALVQENQRELCNPLKASRWIETGSSQKSTAQGNHVRQKQCLGLPSTTESGSAVWLSGSQQSTQTCRGSLSLSPLICQWAQHGAFSCQGRRRRSRKVFRSSSVLLKPHGDYNCASDSPLYIALYTLYNALYNTVHYIYIYLFDSLASLAIPLNQWSLITDSFGTE